MIVKNPVVLDTSYGNRGTNWTLAKPYVHAVLCKASEGVVIRDIEFSSSWSQLGILNIPRAAYHFYRKAVQSVAQAKYFSDTINLNGGLKMGDKVVLDVEEDGCSIVAIIDCLQNIEIQTGHKPIMYSRALILNALSFSSLSAAQRDYIKGIQIWTAGYPSNPDGFDSPLPAYIPDQSRYGSVVLWQYAGDMAHNIPGIPGDLDFNWIDPTFYEMWRQDTGAEPVDPPLQQQLIDRQVFFPGSVYLKYESYTTHGTINYHVIEVETDKGDFFVSPLPVSNGYVPDLLKKYKLDFAVNNDGFTSNVIAGYAASEGAPYGKEGVEETIFASKTNSFTWTRQSPLWNAFSFPNRLVLNGAMASINKDPKEYRGRTAFGYNKDQTLAYLVCVDGKDYNEGIGMSFQEVAQILLSLGCEMGVMFDGGNSTTMAYNSNGTPKVLNVPSGEDLVASYGLKMRRVANIVGWRMKGTIAPPPPGGDMVTYETKKVVTPRKTPSMWENTTKGELAVGTRFDSNVTKTLDVVPPISGQVGPIPWVQMPDGFWLPMEYKGMTYVKAVSVTPPPPPPPAVTVVHTVEFMSDLTLRIDGQPYPPV